MENWLKEMDLFSHRHAFSAGQYDTTLYPKMGDSQIPLHPPTARIQAEPCGDFYDTEFRNHPPKGKVVVISTLYVRGVETLGFILPRIRSAEIDQIIFREYMGEHRYGVLNGTFDDEMREKYPDVHEQRTIATEQRRIATERGERHLWVPPGVDKDGVQGESQHQLCQRTRQYIEDARTLYQQGVRTIIFNGHGSSVRALQMNILDIESSDEVWKNWRKLQNCQVDLIRGGEHFSAVYPGHPEPEPLTPRIKTNNSLLEAQLG